jgi:hypothetical protein
VSASKVRDLVDRLVRNRFVEDPPAGVAELDRLYSELGDQEKADLHAWLARILGDLIRGLAARNEHVPGAMTDPGAFWDIVLASLWPPDVPDSLEGLQD